ncbi:Homeodomain-like DNA binding domain-containing transcription factor [Phycomyces blakesleeanus NRRL 1555(-)]|uniref:Homeodomain-like DNA binding domain-containing transcription factor n=1 Tax=Phycomyces blakesleeanus (strain ATCC 8743b / DSM 1359 / FGSC 10004 / NBRC 33097 / NRRL 1555) TaxID=763407 RepID=A0A167NLF0_PHYB8|nr:Homeodomain-like DNA binding domain-containing transcription factor [Phycomyces blakesleeanus NRRL 1555(-)]OAD76194.1 Homeodomain-like DNA binding domain-containing transcription factor [Phycomyces blakesleeanus NRRL 1555(-)]|eukprot:XP_018294234.1 Homeodomain-like DNA binding domain-containing transcription factor [Phycomyces blakesleeanus NRRL 1555(-)]
MSTVFLFEYGHVNVADENSSPELMEYIIDRNDFFVETIAIHTDYLENDKVRFFDLRIEKCMSVSAAAKQLGIHIRTAQRWVRQYNVCPEYFLRDFYSIEKSSSEKVVERYN